MGYLPTDSVNMDDEQTKRKPDDSITEGHAREDLRTAIDLRKQFNFRPEATTAPDGEAVWRWDLEVESRYREDGLPVRPVDLNYGRASVDLKWGDGCHCVLYCQLPPGERNLSDLHWGGERAILATHRYIGRVSKIRGIDRAGWLGHIVTAYCAHGGAREYDTTDLMRAAAKWSPQRIQRLLKLGVDVNDENMIGETALSYAAREGRQDAFEILLTAGARTDVSFEGHTLLHEAAHGGNVQIISILIHRGLQVSAVNWMGLTPIWNAVAQRRVEAAEYLLAEGAGWKVEPWKTTSAFPRIKEGFDLVSHAESTLGADHRLTKMLRDLMG